MQFLFGYALFSIRDGNILSKKELHRSLQVALSSTCLRGVGFRLYAFDEEHGGEDTP